MNKLLIVGIAAFFAFALFLVVAPQSEAGVLDFNFGSCALVVQTCVANTDTGHPVLDYLLGGFDLKTSGFIGATPANLFVKEGTPDETGLGLFLGPENEIGPGESVSIDLSGIAKAGVTTGTLTISSIQAGEGAIVSDATGDHFVTESDSTGVNTIPIDFTVADPVVTVTAGSGSILATGDLEITPGVGLTPVPEVSSLLLFATSIVGLLLLKKRIL